VTKLDVLDGLDTIRVCVVTGPTQRRHDAAATLRKLCGVPGVYEDMPGWKESTVGIKSYE